MDCAVIFGGNGFIGTFFASYLISDLGYNSVYLCDIEPVDKKDSQFRAGLVKRFPQIHEQVIDVRSPIDWVPKENIKIIANFAAVHREPGHVDKEYFQTNLLGAENVCSWAEKHNCQNIIFTSSISTYGPSETEKHEGSLPVPTTPYGCSKLVAEKIHHTWLSADKSKRNLVIVRPGVVFGPGEGGNVSRLIKALVNHYFFYTGNRDTRKAGIYVKELCSALVWAVKKQEDDSESYILFNMSMNPGPSIEEYVTTICKVAKIKRFIPDIPYQAILAIAYIIDFFAKPLGISHPFSPTRIRKLVRSNNIKPNHLIENEYQYRYSLESALSDWKESYPQEWGK
jgi:nucleoside-diphosphate-sugar epimerase